MPESLLQPRIPLQHATGRTRHQHDTGRGIRKNPKHQKTGRTSRHDEVGGNRTKNSPVLPLVATVCRHLSRTEEKVRTITGQRSHSRQSVRTLHDIMRQLEEVRKIFAIEKELRTIKNRGYFPVPHINPQEEKIETAKDKDKILERIDEIATAMIQAARQSEENLAREQEQARVRDKQLRSVRQTDRSGLNFFAQANSTPVRNNNSKPDNQGVHFKTNPTHHAYSTTSDDNDPYEPPENDSIIQTASPPQTHQPTTSTTKPINCNTPW